MFSIGSEQSGGDCNDRQVAGYPRCKRRGVKWPCASNVINAVSNTALKVMDTLYTIVHFTADFPAKEEKHASFFSPRIFNNKSHFCFLLFVQGGKHLCLFNTLVVLRACLVFVSLSGIWCSQRDRCVPLPPYNENMHAC